MTWTPAMEAELRWHLKRVMREMRCASKKKFGSEGSAQFSAEHTGERFRVKLAAYHCEICGFWHLTSKPQLREAA